MAIVTHHHLLLRELRFAARRGCGWKGGHLRSGA
jgi:hypothetical protein